MRWRDVGWTLPLETVSCRLGHRVGRRVRLLDIVKSATDIAESEVCREGRVRVAFGSCLLADEDGERTATSRRRVGLLCSGKRTRHSRLEAESGVSDSLGDRVECEAVVLASLLREAEECEEEEGTNDD